MARSWTWWAAGARRLWWRETFVSLCPDWALLVVRLVDWRLPPFFTKQSWIDFREHDKDLYRERLAGLPEVAVSLEVGEGLLGAVCGRRIGLAGPGAEPAGEEAAALVAVEGQDVQPAEFGAQGAVADRAGGGDQGRLGPAAGEVADQVLGPPATLGRDLVEAVEEQQSRPSRSSSRRPSCPARSSTAGNARAGRPARSRLR